jgi:Glycosyl hydrolases family 6
MIASPAAVGIANAGVPHAPRSNPLAGLRWGVYRGPYYNSIFPDYQSARGRNRRLLAKIALRPLMYTFGDWFSDSDARSVARDFIQSTTGGNPAVLSQVAIFRLDPWEGAACPNGSWNAANQASYRRWVDNFAAGIGSARVALVLQPDLPFATCAPSKVPLELVNYAARRFNGLPYTTVYVDAGAPDTSRRSTRRCRRSSRRYPGDVNNPRVCRNRFDHLCVTLGIPATTHVANRRWHLSAADGGLAFRYVDAYVWAGRPWLFGAAAQFDFQRALGLAASTPF